MSPSNFTYGNPASRPSDVVKEEQIDCGFIGKLQGLKHEYRADTSLWKWWMTTKGFSNKFLMRLWGVYANLRNFRQFYCTHPDQAICYTGCSKLSWSYNRLIVRVDDPKARALCLAEGAAQQCSVQQLERNIQTHSSLLPSTSVCCQLRKN